MVETGTSLEARQCRDFSKFSRNMEATRDDSGNTTSNKGTYQSNSGKRENFKQKEMQELSGSTDIFDQSNAKAGDSNHNSTTFGHAPRRHHDLSTQQCSLAGDNSVTFGGGGQAVGARLHQAPGLMPIG
jgi:hypothetical protein